MTTIPNQAVTEYQILSSIVNRKLSENKTVENSRFWLKEYNVRGGEIAARYNLDLIDLVNAWENWTTAVKLERASQKVGA